MWKNEKPPCVHTNPNYHQGTPGPPEWAEIIDLMMPSPAKKTDSKKHFWKKSCVYSECQQAVVKISPDSNSLLQRVNAEPLQVGMVDRRTSKREK